MAQVMTRGMVKSKLIIYVMGATKAFHKNLSPFGLIVMNIDKWVIRSQAPIINGVQFID